MSNKFIKLEHIPVIVDTIKEKIDELPLTDNMIDDSKSAKDKSYSSEKIEKDYVSKSNLENLVSDKGFIKNTTGNLNNYYTKTETYNRNEVNNLIQGLNKLEAKIVTSLPITNILYNVIYLIETSDGSNVYNQYMYIEGEWAELGTTSVDYSNIYTKQQVDNTFAKISDVLTSSQVDNKIKAVIDDSKKSSSATYSSEKLETIFSKVADITELRAEIEAIKQALANGGSTSGGTIINPITPSLTATALVNDITVGWNLGNTFESTGSNVKDEAKNHTANEATAYETWWGSPVITKAMIQSVKAKGFNAIRVPITWCHHFMFDSNGNLSIAPVFMNRIKEVVQWILDEDMYCIVNTHHDDANYGEGQADATALGNPWNMTYPLQWLHADDVVSNPEVKETQAEMNRRFKMVWTVIANQFRSFGDKLIFEGFNEIQGWRRDWSTPTSAQLDNTNRLNQTFVDAVRATGGNNSTRILTIQTYGSAHSIEALNGFVMPTDTVKDGIIVQIHFYSNQAGEQAKAMLQLVKDKLGDIPVILGEFGVSTGGGIETEKEASRVIKNLTAIAKSFDYKVFFWDGFNFKDTTYEGLLNRQTLTWDRPLITQALIDGLTADPNDDGMVTNIIISSMNDCVYGSICSDPYHASYTGNEIKELGRIYQTTSGHFSPAKFFTVTGGDSIQLGSTHSGWRIDKYAYYDENWNVVDIVGNSNTPISIVTTVPNNPAIKYVGFSVFNPWGNYTVAQLTQYMANSGLSIIFKCSSESQQVAPVFKTQVNATGISLSQTTLNLNGEQTVKLVATATPSNSTNSVIWSTSSPYVATVDKNGNVTSTGNGTAKIIVRVGSQTATATVNVTGLTTKEININTYDGVDYYGLNDDGTQFSNISASQQAITTKPITLYDVPTGTKLNVSLRINGSAGWARILRWVFYDASGNFISSDFFKTASGTINATPDSGTKGITVPANAKIFRLCVFNPWAGELSSPTWYANQFAGGLVIHIDTNEGSLTIE